MLLNFLIGAGLIAGALAIPLLMLAFLAGRSTVLRKQYADAAPTTQNAPRVINEPLTTRRLNRNLNSSASVAEADIAPLTKAS